MAELPVAKLPYDQTHRFDITAEAPVFDVAGRNRYVAAFELPELKKPALFSLRSFFAYAPYQERRPIMQPSLLFLDEDRHIVHAIDQTAFRYAPEGLWEGSGLEVRVRIDPAVTKARFLVVYAGALDEADAKGVTMPVVMTPVMIGSVMVPMTSGGGTAATLPTPTGSLRLRISDAEN